MNYEEDYRIIEQVPGEPLNPGDILRRLESDGTLTEEILIKDEWGMYYLLEWREIGDRAVFRGLKGLSEDLDEAIEIVERG